MKSHLHINLIANTFKENRMLIFILFLGVISSCREDDLGNDQFDRIDFNILTLDEEQIERNIFSTGSEIIIALKLTNNSNKIFEWKSDYTCQLFQAGEFLVVYKRNNSDETAETYFLVGVPYQSPINCQAINLPPQKIPVGGNLFIVKLPWSSNPGNQTLSTGEYFVKANIDININGRSESLNLATEFKVK